MISKLKNTLVNYRKRFDNEIKYSELQKINRGRVSIIDVRSKQEFIEGHLPNAINIPLYNIENEIENFVKNKNEIIVVYCEYGGRSKKAVRKIQQKGYINVYNLKGGLNSI